MDSVLAQPAAAPHAGKRPLFDRYLAASLVRSDRIVRIRHTAGRGAVSLSTGAEIAVSRRHMGALKALTKTGVDYSNANA